MSTRAMYTFKDEHGTIHVYKHHDGYPEGGVSFIRAAVGSAWHLPRFEADDFAAAFVAANKDGGGGVRLCGTDVKEPWDFSTDSEYWYLVTCVDGVLNVAIHEIDWWEDDKQSTEIFSGTLKHAAEKFCQ